MVRNKREVGGLHGTLYVILGHKILRRYDGE